MFNWAVARMVGASKHRNNTQKFRSLPPDEMVPNQSLKGGAQDEIRGKAGKEQSGE